MTTNPNPSFKKNILAGLQVPTHVDPELQQFLQSIKETVEGFAGNRGQPKERFATIAELEQAGVINAVVKGRRAVIGDLAANTISDLELAGSDASDVQIVPPDPPSDLTGVGGLFVHVLRWTNPDPTTFDFIDVRRSSTPNFEDAATIARIRTDRLEVAYNAPTSAHYWIAAVNDAGFSSFVPDLSVAGLHVVGGGQGTTYFHDPTFDLSDAGLVALPISEDFYDFSSFPQAHWGRSAFGDDVQARTEILADAGEGGFGTNALRFYINRDTPSSISANQLHQFAMPAHATGIPGRAARFFMRYRFETFIDTSGDGPVFELKLEAFTRKADGSNAVADGVGSVTKLIDFGNLDTSGDWATFDISLDISSVYSLGAANILRVFFGPDMSNTFGGVGAVEVDMRIDTASIVFSDKFSGAAKAGSVPDPVTETGKILKDDGNWASRVIIPTDGEMAVVDSGGTEQAKMMHDGLRSILADAPAGSASGRFTMQQLTLADDATGVFTAGNYGVCFLLSNFNATTYAHFGKAGTQAPVDYGSGSNVSMGATNPDVDTDVNIWPSAVDEISIKNRLGDERVFYLFAFTSD